MPPAATSLLIQLGAFAASPLLAAFLPFEISRAWLALALTQGLIAAVASMLAGQPRWWWALHLVFMPTVVTAQGWSIHPGWFAGGFIVLAALYWNSARGQVPLYLSNITTAQAVLALLPRDQAVRLVDAGCGTGSLIARIARARPDCPVAGIENAPLPWLICWLRGLPLPNCEVRFGNLWAQRFDEAEVVYAFLSPVPMASLWQKLCMEMKPGALLMSNSFEVPGVVPDEVVELSDRRGTQLFCYRVPGKMETTLQGT